LPSLGFISSVNKGEKVRNMKMRKDTFIMLIVTDQSI
jgi:hypothetical protein